jgi:hypothetical protein
LFIWYNQYTYFKKNPDGEAHHKQGEDVGGGRDDSRYHQNGYNGMAAVAEHEVAVQQMQTT